MESSRLVLRFRDPVGVNTIEEHNSIVESEGAVWWGWWKKDSESIPSDLFSELTTLKAVNGRIATVRLLDRTKERCVLADLLRVQQGTLNRSEKMRVPKYYRTLKGIPAWFLIKNIRDVVYPDLLAEKMGERTLLDVGDQPKEPDDDQWEVLIQRKRDTLLHLSDLHFGDDHGFPLNSSSLPIGDTRRPLSTTLLNELEKLGVREKIGAVVVTGDFATRGVWSNATLDDIINELHNLVKGLQLPQEAIIAIPGNHDIVRYPDGKPVDPTRAMVDHMKNYAHETGFRHMANRLCGRDVKKPLHWITTVHLQPLAVQICALNSCNIVAWRWTEYGYVGAGGLQLLEKLRKHRLERKTVRVMALHHHLIPVTRVDQPGADGVSLTLDAVELMDAANRAGVRIALHGHQHLSRLAHYRKQPTVDEEAEKYAGLIISGVGSAGAKADRRLESARNSFSLLRFEQMAVEVSTYEFHSDGSSGRRLIHSREPLEPLR